MHKLKTLKTVRQLFVQKSLKRWFKSPGLRRHIVYTPLERYTLVAFALAGLIVGCGAYYFVHGTAAWAFNGAIEGVSGGSLVAIVSISLNRILIFHPSGRP